MLGKGAFNRGARWPNTTASSDVGLEYKVRYICSLIITLKKMVSCWGRVPPIGGPGGQIPQRPATSV